MYCGGFAAKYIFRDCLGNKTVDRFGGVPASVASGRFPEQKMIICGAENFGAVCSPLSLIFFSFNFSDCMISGVFHAYLVSGNMYAAIEPVHNFSAA